VCGVPRDSAKFLPSSFIYRPPTKKSTTSLKFFWQEVCPRPNITTVITVATRCLDASILTETKVLNHTIGPSVASEKVVTIIIRLSRMIVKETLIDLRLVVA
jgi:hypothetical protein